MPGRAHGRGPGWNNHVRPEVARRILPVDDDVATRYAHLPIPDRRNEVDALIAATALIRGLTVVTRNVKDFEGTGVIIVDPGWDDFTACASRAKSLLKPHSSSSSNNER
jgi:hypothetical protein